MEKMELTKHQELNEFERHLLSKPVYHSSYVHQRGIAGALGLSFVAIGCGIIGVTTFVDTFAVFSAAAIIMGALLEVFVFTAMLIPCRCGKTPTLTAKCRHRLTKLKNKRYMLAITTGSIGVGFAWNWYMFNLMASVGSTLGSMAMMAMAVQALQATGYFALTIGLLMMVSSILNKTDWLHMNRIIPEHEVQRIVGLTGETQDELHSLIDFHLKAGNISTAEKLSRKLLLMVESDFYSNNSNLH
jgi:hypothetical protein